MKKARQPAAAESNATTVQKPRFKLKAPHLNWRALLPMMLATMLLTAALVSAWQVFQVVRESNSRDLLESQREKQASAIGALLADTRGRVAAALADPNIVQALQSGDAAARDNAMTALRLALPEMAEAQFFSADLAEVLNSDLRQFGYAKAAQLMKAQGGSAPVQSIVVGKGGRMLSFAEAVKSDERVVAVIWLTLPMQVMLDEFAHADIADGRIELHQGDGRNDLVLAHVGESSFFEAVPDVGRPIEGSLFRVATRPPDLLIFGSHNPWLLLVVTGIFGITGLTGLWLRKVGLEAGYAKLSGKLGAKPSIESNLTLRETMRLSPATAARPAAAPRPRPKPATSDTIAPPTASIMLDRTIFRAYDIRGVLDKSLNADIARQIGRAVGSEGMDRGLREIVVGRDGRLSGPELAAALIEGLRQAGMDVIDIGQVPTPLVYYATYHLNTGSGIAVTGSHNPPDYNGFKIVLGGETLAEDAIQALYLRICENRYTSGRGGLQSIDIKADYIERVVSDVQVENRMKVVVDCGNGVPGSIAPAVLDGIGCEVLPLYCDVDGNFPNHHPDPSDPVNLRDLILTVKQMGADLGLAFDGDGDRLGVVTKSGEVIYPDRILMLFARDVLSRNPGASIIYDVKCTGKLQPEILKHGGSPIMWKTGHSLIKAKMRETDAELAGEMSGHFFFRERWYGFDDAIYAAARLMEILAGDLEGRDAQTIFDSLAKGVSTPELKIAMVEGEHYRFIERFRERASFEGARLTTIDGVRADWPDGWGLVRASNTTPVLVLRFDADNDQALLRIQDAFRRQLLALDAKLKLPF
ncbi:MAG: phosphomannomutase/phosphoglucomutase [Tahibacter sp.]